MSTYWLRGVRAPYCGSGKDTFSPSVILYYWYRYILGYQFIEEVLTGSYSYNASIIDSGSDGVLVDTSYRFAAASASFTSGDVGKYLCIKDPTNAVNCGIYRITNYVSGTEVDIDYLSPDYPVAKTGCDWWLFDPAAATTLANGTYVIFRVNHATSPYEFQMYVDQSANVTLRHHVAGESGAWNTGTHAWNSGVSLHSRYFYANCYVPASLCPRQYAVATDDGSFGMICHHYNDGTAEKSFGFYGVLDPIFEAGRVASEKVFSCGGQITASAGHGRTSGDHNYRFDIGSIWSQNLNKGSYQSRWVAWNYTRAYYGGGYHQDYFTRDVVTPNHRDETEYDGLPIWVHGDSEVSQFPVNSLWGAIPKDYLWYGAVKGLGELATFGSHAYIHWRDGVVTPWPGIRLGGA